MTAHSPEPQLPGIERNHSGYEDLLNSHLEFIESQCKRAIQHMAMRSGRFSDIQLENDSLELFNQAIDLIRQDDFAFIRRFDHRSRLTTYLTAMISRKAVDLVRRKRGRSRARERAQAHGRLGMQLFQKIFARGMGVPAAIQELLSETNPSLLPDQVRDVATHIIGKDGIPAPIVIRLPQAEEDNIASGHSPEWTALEADRRKRILDAIQQLDFQLTGRERLLLKLRFPVEPEAGTRPAGEIAITLGISRKAVYRRLDRLLEKCRGIITDSGMNAADLEPPHTGNPLPLSDPKQGSQYHE